MIKYIYFLTALFCFSFYTLQSQTVTTWANSSGITDDLIYGPDGNIYGSGFNTGIVYKIEPNGTVSQFATGFTNANGLAFDDAGNLYVVDYGNFQAGNGSITKVDPGGNQEILIDNLTTPSGLVKMLNEDTLIYTVYNSNLIRKVALTGGPSVSFLAGGQLDGPVGLTYYNGELYVANYNNNKYFRVEADQTLTLVVSIPISPQSTGFIEIVDDHIYATAILGNKIYKANFDGEYVLLAGGPSGTVDGDVSVARFNGPNGILSNPGGDSLIISDFNTGNIRVIDGIDPTVGLSSLMPAIVQNLNVYPNPVIDQITFDFTVIESLNELVIELVDVTGRLIHSEKLEQHVDAGNQHVSFRIPESIVTGNYLYQIRDESRLLAGGKIQFK